MISCPTSGVAGTCYAFYNAVRASKVGDSVTVNRMFRYRIYGQAFTIVVIMGGAYYYNGERLLQRKVYLARKEKEAKEKTDAWIRELEVRNEEEMALIAKNQQMKNAKKEAIEEDSPGDETPGGRGVLDALKKLEEAKAKLERATKAAAKEQARQEK